MYGVYYVELFVYICDWVYTIPIIIIDSIVVLEKTSIFIKIHFLHKNFNHNI